MPTATFAFASRMSAATAAVTTDPLHVDLALLLVCVSVLSALGTLSWALLERRERRSCQAQNDKLSSALLNLTEHHYSERVSAEERHLLAHDSTVRTVLEHLERTLLGKPKS